MFSIIKKEQVRGREKHLYMLDVLWVLFSLPFGLLLYVVEARMSCF
jgi:hypothetical protein